MPTPTPLVDHLEEAERILSDPANAHLLRRLIDGIQEVLRDARRQGRW